jgi:hypothetical protein
MQTSRVSCIEAQERLSSSLVKVSMHRLVLTKQLLRPLMALLQTRPCLGQLIYCCAMGKSFECKLPEAPVSTVRAVHMVIFKMTCVSISRRTHTRFDLSGHFGGCGSISSLVPSTRYHNRIRPELVGRLCVYPLVLNQTTMPDSWDW